MIDAVYGDEQLIQDVLPVPIQRLTQDRILAAIDVGTNSIHMVVVQIKPDLPAFTTITREKSTVRLGERCPETGNLTPAGIERAIVALKHCKAIATNLQAEDIVAVATSAVREAPNGREFLKQVKDEVGLSVDLISGQEEARRIYLGVLSAMEFNHQPHVVIDIGGGSTELVLGNGHDPRSLSSTKVGAVRLTSRFITTDPIQDHEFQRLEAFVQGMVERPIEELQNHLKPGETFRLVGTSGTIQCLATIHSHLFRGNAPNHLNGYQFSRDELQNMVDQLRPLSVGERADFPGISARRQEIIVAGAVILLEAMKLLKAESLTICEHALREGLVVDWMLAHGLIEDRLRYQQSVRQRSVLKIARKYQVNLEKSDRIARFALSLFDQTQDILHGWGLEERELLWAAAILHNSGHFISHSAHHKHSYYLIRNGELLGYTESEIELIANIARYHRKSPPKRKHDNYQNLIKLERQVVDQLSAILRLAVALDRRQIGAIEQVTCDYEPETQSVYVRLQAVHPEDDCSLELWSLSEKKACFEAEFNVKLLPILEAVPVVWANYSANVL